MKWCPNCERSVDTQMATCPRDGTFLVTMYDQKAAPDLPRLGSDINGQYRFLAGPVIGGKSAVYKGMQIHIDRTVAIKVLLPQLMNAADISSKFRGEASIASRLNHKYIAAIFDSGLLPQDIPYSIGAYCDGIKINEYAKQDGIGPAELIPLFLKLLEAFDHLHQRDIVYLALKPNHVVVVTEKEDGSSCAPEPRLLDLSHAELAGQTRQPVRDLSSIFRNYGFPAPEMLKGDKVDARSDIYSLGCLLYRSFTGQAPFTGRDASELREKHLSEKPKRLTDLRVELPAVLNNCVMTALEKNPNDRYASIQDLKRDLMMISPSIF